MIIILYLTSDLIGTEKFSDYVGLPLYTIVPGILIILGILALFQSNKIKEISKWALFFLVLGFTLDFLAEQTWNLYEHVLDIDPFPSIADVFFVAAVCSIFTSLIIFLKPVKHKIPRKYVMFAITVSSLVLIPSLIISYDYAIEDNVIEIFVALLYPIIDSILLVPAIIAFVYSLKQGKNFFWLMILAGIFVFLVADALFLYLIIEDTYEDGHPVDILWVSSYTIWAFMMYYLIQNSKKNTSKDSQQKYENYKVGRFQKFGVPSTLVLINVIIGIILVGMNSFFDLSKNEMALSFFSLILMTIVVIFSSIIISLNSKLNKTLQSRTTKLEKVSEELIKAERLSAIGELASRFSHDLRNPLNVIQASIENLRLVYGETKKTEKSFARIGRSMDRITHQIEGVLDYVRQRPSLIEDYSINKILKSAKSMLKIPDTIKLNLPSNDMIISCDDKQCEIVFYNLIHNSIQAIDKENGEITIRIIENNKEILIEFEDSGPGIKDEDLKIIFDPLFTTKQNGTGLGLSSCKNIIGNFGGNMTVSTNPTIFTIHFPKKIVRILSS